MSIEELVALEIPLTEIRCNDASNCRGTIGPADIMDLIESLKENGQIQPIVIREMEVDTFKFDLVAGFRRYKSFLVLKAEAQQDIFRLEKTIADNPGLQEFQLQLSKAKENLKRFSKIQCIVKNVDDAKAKILNLEENIKRKKLSLMQEAIGIKEYHDRGFIAEVVAEMLGVSPDWIRMRYRILELPAAIQDEIALDLLSQEQIKDIHSLKSKEKMFDAIEKIKKHKLLGKRGVVKIKKKKVNKRKKVRRTRVEIFDMMEEIADLVGEGFHSRCLAWTAGEISDIDLRYSMEGYAIDNRLEYRVPRGNIPRIH